MRILPWHRRHALALAAQLPDEAEDAAVIAELLTKIVAEFLTPEKVEARPLPIFTNTRRIADGS